MKNVKFLIQAGGEGVRVRPYSFILPKCMLPVSSTLPCGVPIIQLMIERIKMYGVNETQIIVVTNKHNHSLIKSYLDSKGFKDIIHLVETQSLNTGGILMGGVLRFLLNNKAGDLVVINGDLWAPDLMFEDLVSYHRKCNNQITHVFAINKIPNNFGIVDGYELPSRKGPNVFKIREKEDIVINVSVGINVFKYSTIKDLDYCVPISMPEIINNFLKDNHNDNVVGAYQYNGEWLDIGSKHEST
jgi:mannose-1-phosphate guanylyltransferase